MLTVLTIHREPEKLASLSLCLLVDFTLFAPLETRMNVVRYEGTARRLIVSLHYLV